MESVSALPLGYVSPEELWLLARAGGRRSLLPGRMDPIVQAERSVEPLERAHPDPPFMNQLLKVELAGWYVHEWHVLGGA